MLCVVEIANTLTFAAACTATEWSLVARPFQGGVAAPLIKRSRSLAAQTGWLVISNKIRIATRISIWRLRDLLLTTPSAPLRNGIFYQWRSHPSLKTEGNGTLSQLTSFPFTPRRTNVSRRILKRDTST